MIIFLLNLYKLYSLSLDKKYNLYKFNKIYKYIFFIRKSFYGFFDYRDFKKISLRLNFNEIKRNIINCDWFIFKKYKILGLKKNIFINLKYYLNKIVLYKMWVNNDYGFLVFKKN